MGRKEKALLIAIGANLFLVALKFFLAAISGSMALHMSGWHSVQGLFVSLAVFAGFLFSRKEENRLTRGISQVENIVALLISLFVFYLAYKMFIKMTRPHMPMLEHVPIVTLGAILGAAICYMMARFKTYVGQQTHSPGLVADGYHCRIHVVMEMAVVIGLAGYMIGFSNLDMLAAVVVTLFVLQTGIRLFTRALVSLFSKEVSADYSCHVEPSKLRVSRPKTTATLAAVTLLGYILSGFYSIQWNERGIVRRFGRQTGNEVTPGLHYRLPWPIEAVDKVNVDDIRKLETDVFLILTGDDNLIQTNVATHYQVKNASAYLFNLEDPAKIVRDASRSALRQVVGEMNIDSILATSKSELVKKTRLLAQSSLDAWNSGIHIVGVQLLNADPPAEVMEAFRDVASAREDRETYINKAYAYRDSTIPEARGRAEKIIMEAEGFRSKRVHSARGEAFRFKLKHAEHDKARKVTETRLFVEAMEKVLAPVEKILINPEVKQGVMDLWFFNPEQKKIPIE
ncbi:MAG: FtsH protease activity modulator HflK [Deltaproteobacteria bacterium]|nr:FtsH protease activity modulator HflK [Deltaproteobacteria bacterium]MBW2154147.1 FtsH protease activity modulator HflK [Deltaproteobacteria bacterium]